MLSREEKSVYLTLATYQVLTAQVCEWVHYQVLTLQVCEWVHSVKSDSLQPHGL